MERGIPTLKEDVFDALKIISNNNKLKNYFFDLVTIPHRVLDEKYEYIFKFLADELKEYTIVRNKYSADFKVYGKDISKKKVFVRVEFATYTMNDIEDIYKGLWDISIIRRDSELYYPEYEMKYYNIYNSSKKILKNQIKNIADSIKLAFKMPSNFNKNLFNRINNIMPIIYSNNENLCEQIINIHRNELTKKNKRR